MGSEFTPEQEQVIKLRNRNLLVSAAAGAGKTTVLVERIIKRLTEDTPPLNVDELLVVTYTEAAAAEMKDRIRSAIEDAMENEQDAKKKEHLQRQATLVHQAKIATIHGFCLSVIRDYFHTIDLEPGFRVAENGELELLKSDAWDKVLEEWYQSSKEAFYDLVDSFADGKNDDSQLQETVFKLYVNSKSYPNPITWLDNCARYYGMSTPNELEHAPFVTKLLGESKAIFKDVEDDIKYLQFVCSEPDGPILYMDALDSDLETMQELQSADSFDAMYRRLSALTWKALSRKQQDCPEEKKKAVKDVRNKYKVLVKGEKDKFFSKDAATLIAEMNQVRERVEVLIELVKDFSKEYSKKKKSRNVIDFDDMQHYALQILTQETDGVFVPTAAAREYQECFKEVMIDEYQDSNYLQEALLTSVSTISKGENNMFMVGDVKQSIYGFRQARPKLFMEKYGAYTDTDSDQQKIDLHKNFRSRREVIESTNFIFKQVMKEEFGGIEYDDKAALHVGATYENKPGNETEVLLIDTSELLEDVTVIEIEARIVAKRIKTLVAQKHPVFDKATKEYRHVQYKDIVILLRSFKGWSDAFLKALKEENIPAHSVQKEGYFETREISLLLEYLRVLDNPRQDIPLAAVLSSMFVGVTAEDLATIKTKAQEKSFYDCVMKYIEVGEDASLKAKLQAFIEQVEYFRNKVPYTAIHDLLWEIMDKTGYDNYMSALPAGQQRHANLEMLIEKAISFESTSYKGLYHFVRYIEKLQKYKVDYGEANVQNDAADVVRLMTIHHSKGLEFPIVFVPSMGKGFNLQDIKKKALLHSEYGVGVDFIALDNRERTRLFLKNILQRETVNGTVEEELRLLYVAMTRAKEKLILTGTINNLQNLLESYSQLQCRDEEALSYRRISGAKKYFDWVLPALYRNQVFAPVLDKFGMEHPQDNPFYGEQLPFHVQVLSLGEDDEQQDEENQENTDVPSEQLDCAGDIVTKENLEAWDTAKVYDEHLKEYIETQFSYVYQYEKETNTKQKVSVSELKKKAYMEEDEIEEEVVIPFLPKFMQQETKTSGAMRGTAYHRVLELLDFSSDYDASKLVDAIGEMVSEHLLSQEMADCIQVADILTFIESSVGERMKKAAQSKLFHAEQPFVLGEENEDAQMILVQGIIDVYFEEDGELVVLDYKTDRVSKPEELVERYKLQLDYYAKVLEQVTGKRVKEKMIYSFTLQKEIQL